MELLNHLLHCLTRSIHILECIIEFKYLDFYFLNINFQNNFQEFKKDQNMEILPNLIYQD